MSKWFTSVWFEGYDCCPGSEVETLVHGPFESDEERSEAVDALRAENEESHVIVVALVDVEGDDEVLEICRE